MFTKRVFDLVLAIILGVALLIPSIGIAVLVKMTSPGPAFLWTDRIGRGGKVFAMPKFRSMSVDTSVVATDLLKAPKTYITKIGYYLRKTSLEEIPQIYSVLVGGMSFVGPRPALESQKELLKERSLLGIDLLIPGITGRDQVNGRDELSTEGKISMELEYLKKQSFGFDLYILWLTLLALITRDGISH